MKRYDLIIFTFFLFLICLLSFPIVNAHLPLSGKVIYIDRKKLINLSEGYNELSVTRVRERR